MKTVRGGSHFSQFCSVLNSKVLKESQTVRSILVFDALCHVIVDNIREFINRPLSCQMKLV